MKGRDYIIIVFTVCLSALLINFFPRSDVEISKSSIDPHPFAECLSLTKKTFSDQKNDMPTYITFWNLCSHQLYNDLARDDFAIRREKFKRQELDERVNMWLVVAITLSGVVLSGVQLVMSYKIAWSGKDLWAISSDLAVEQGKISYKTSVVGLAILSLSLAFFGVYVRWIYNQNESGPPLYPPGMFPSGIELPPGVFAPIKQNDKPPLVDPVAPAGVLKQN